MTNPLIGRTTTPAERAAGCFLSYSFRNRQDVVLDGGTIYGTPVINNGLKLNGTTDYVTYGLGSEFTYASKLSYEIVFYPSFSLSDSASHMWCDTSTTRNAVVHTASNTLRVYAGGTNVLDVSDATYSAYWRLNKRNVLSVFVTSGSNSMWLNGHNIVNSATAWTPGLATPFYISKWEGGASGYFPGKITLMKVFNTTLVETDHRNLWLSGDY